MYILPCRFVRPVLPASLRGRHCPLPLRAHPLLSVRPILHHSPLAPGLRVHGLGRGPGRLLLQPHALGATRSKHTGKP